MDFGFCRPANPQNSSPIQPSCIGEALVFILALRKTRLNYGDLQLQGWLWREKWDGTKTGTAFWSNVMERKGPVSVCVFSIRTLICNERDTRVIQQLQHETRVLVGKWSIWVPSLWTQTQTDSQKGSALGDPATLCSHKREIKGEREGKNMDLLLWWGFTRIHRINIDVNNSRIQRNKDSYHFTVNSFYMF